jgi:acetyl esterase/lipase
MKVLSSLIVIFIGTNLFAAEPIMVWPGLAPGETTQNKGETLPRNPKENPPATRITNITAPSLTVHLAPQPNGTGVLILPGGAYARVVIDKEGTEIADWLNTQGVSAFVLHYRTKTNGTENDWQRPLQDVQRAMSLIRTRSQEFGLKPDRIGIMGFSAGGNAAARLLTSQNHRSYQKLDAVDNASFRPDFGMLVYPWNLYDAKQDRLIEDLKVTKDCPPTLLIHTDDDRSTSLGPIHFYSELKKLGIPSELHIYNNGGHGYGLRPVDGSFVSTWPVRAGQWLSVRGLLKK